MTYKSLLNKAWKQHKAPKDSSAPTVISTFAGCGGSSLGYSMAGFRELLAVEWEEHAAEVFRTNFNDVDLYHGDIRDLSIKEVFERTGLARGDLDLFDGSPPCQGFSMSGARCHTGAEANGLMDSRNFLFRDYARLLEELQPRAFIMENVKGMVVGKMKGTFLDILSSLKDCGYQVKAWVFNTKYFQVPQARERIIFFGARNDLDIVPEVMSPMYPIYTSRDACKGAKKPVDPLPELSGQYAGMWHQIPVGKTLRDVKYPGQGRNFSDLVKVNPHRPFPTIMSHNSGHGHGTFIHWAENRIISTEEAARAMSFPDQFKWTGNFSEKWARIGNAVPPLFARAIGQHVRKTILRDV